jgi:hypothetical protein
MKTTVLLSVFATLGVMRCAAADLHAPPDFLHAIRLVESGDRYDGPCGKAGELGPYQFRLAVWRQYTSAPFSQAQTAFADHVAANHYFWIARRLRTGGVPATSWNIAAAWNSGVRAVLSGRIPASSRDYATRVVNLMEREATIRSSLTPVLNVAMARQP